MATQNAGLAGMSMPPPGGQPGMPSGIVGPMGIPHGNNAAGADLGMRAMAAGAM
jgi:hypothetical protein